jgi:hypothetical protein
VTSDGWVFRFPRRAECADLFEPEKRLHDLVAGVLPPRIAVPKVEFVAEPGLDFPYRFAGHRFIAGVAADKGDADLLPTLARERSGSAMRSRECNMCGDATPGLAVYSAEGTHDH